MDERPAGALDIAAAVIESATDVDQMKLHKLMYYAQAWYLAWYGTPLFRARIEAWEHGPYIPRVGRIYGERGLGRDKIPAPLAGDSSRLTERQAAALASVIRGYDSLDGGRLADLTKTETPWHEARGDRPRDDSAGRDEIPAESLTGYYRRAGRFGASPPTVEVDPKLAERARRGDKKALVEALTRASKAS